MKIIKDTLLMNDASEFGEVLREYCFVPCKINGGDFGCYSTFDLKPEFRKIKKNCRLGQILLKHLGLNEDGSSGEKEFLEMMNPYLYSNGIVHLGWYWDGDGVLVIRENHKIAYNGDCKHTDWKWIK